MSYTVDHLYDDPLPKKWSIMFSMILVGVFIVMVIMGMGACMWKQMSERKRNAKVRPEAETQ